MAYGYPMNAYEYMAGMNPGPQSIPEWGVNNALGAFQNYGNALGGVSADHAFANALSSANMQARYGPAAQVSIGQMNNDSALRQAQLQAETQRAIAQLQADIARQTAAQNMFGSIFGGAMNAQGGISSQRLAGESATNIAKMQQEGALNLERERSARLNTTLPAIMSLFGGQGGIGGGASIGTNYGASASLNRPTTQPANDQQFRPQALMAPSRIFAQNPQFQLGR